MERDRQFFVILDHFLHFYALNNTKNQNFEKLKKTPGDIIILHKCIKNHDHVLYFSWDMVHDRCNYFSFWAIFCPFSPKKQNFTKMKKNPWRYYHFIYVYQKLWSDDVQFPRYGAQQTDRWIDRQMDRQKKWQRWVSHLKSVCWLH